MDGIIEVMPGIACEKLDAWFDEEGLIESLATGFWEDKNYDTLYLAMAKLAPLERLVLELRYGLFDREARTQAMVAGMLRLSQPLVCRLEKQALQGLRLVMGAEDASAGRVREGYVALYRAIVAHG